MSISSLLPERTLLLWRLRIGIAGALLIGLMLALSVYTLWLLIPAAFLLIISVVLFCWFLPRYFKSYVITVSDRAITVERGVFIKTVYIMPFPRLVFAQGFYSPIARRMGLCCVTLKAARGLLVIPEMDAEDAKRLIEGLAGQKSDD